MQWHLANMLTIGRLALVPVFYVLFLLGIYWAAFLVFTAASFTDLIDGAVARFLKQHSKAGAILDPLADKLLMITTFSCLVSVRLLPLWFLVLVIFRDVFIMGGILILKILKIEVAFKPFLSSKIATLSQMVLGTLSLITLWLPFARFWVYPLSDFAEGAMYLTSALIVITGLQYARRGLEILQDYHANLSGHRT